MEATKKRMLTGTAKLRPRFMFYFRFLVTVPFLLAMVENGRGDPPAGGNPGTTQVKLLLGQPLSSWTASYGAPKSDNGKNAVFQTHEGTAYVIVGEFRADGVRLICGKCRGPEPIVVIVTEVCQSLGVSYKDDADGPKGKFHRYESKDGTIARRLRQTLRNWSSLFNPRRSVQHDTSPMTAALWK